MEVVNAMENRRYAVRSAILIHGSDSVHLRGSKPGFATIHPVTVGDDQKPVIEGGRLLGCGELEQTLAMLSPERGLRFLPSTLLAASSSAIVWWRPPAQERVWFNTHADDVLGQRTGITPQPGLVFAATASDWSVWAVLGNERPNLESPLHQAPYLNVYETGSICTGNVVTPKSLDQASIPAFEAAFWGSRFTHANVTRKGRLVRWKGGPLALWDCLLKGKRKVFPEHALVPVGLTLGEMIHQIAEAGLNKGGAR